MDNRNEIREFLASRRARITPQQAGLTMTVYSAVPGSASADALKLLASWSATVGQAGTNDQGPGTVMAPGPQISDR